MTPQEFKIYLNTPSPNLQNYSFYKAKKGDQITFHHSFTNTKLKGEFIRYEIMEMGTGLFKKFGPKNFKKAKKVIAKVNYNNLYNRNVKINLINEGEAESIEIIK
jgi:hypothetical protein